MNISQHTQQTRKHLVILISGKQRAGKDELAGMLIEEWDRHRHPGEPLLTRRALADKLKVEYYDLCAGSKLSPELREESDGAKIEVVNSLKSQEEHRQGLIDYGQGKKVGNPFYWCERLWEEPGDIVVPDLRYQCEIEFFQELEQRGEIDLFLIRVEAPRDVRLQRGSLNCEDSPSECELDRFGDWDLIAHNVMGRSCLRSYAVGVTKAIRFELGEKTIDAAQKRADRERDLLEQQHNRLRELVGLIPGIDHAKTDDAEFEHAKAWIKGAAHYFATVKEPSSLETCAGTCPDCGQSDVEVHGGCGWSEEESLDGRIDDEDGFAFPQTVEFIVAGEPVVLPYDLLDSEIEIEAHGVRVRLTPATPPLLAARAKGVDFATDKDHACGAPVVLSFVNPRDWHKPSALLDEKRVQEFVAEYRQHLPPHIQDLLNQRGKEHRGEEAPDPVDAALEAVAARQETAQGPKFKAGDWVRDKVCGDVRQVASATCEQDGYFIVKTEFGTETWKESAAESFDLPLPDWNPGDRLRHVTGAVGEFQHFVASGDMLFAVVETVGDKRRVTWDIDNVAPVANRHGVAAEAEPFPQKSLGFQPGDWVWNRQLKEVRQVIRVEEASPHFPALVVVSIGDDGGGTRYSNFWTRSNTAPFPGKVPGWKPGGAFGPASTFLNFTSPDGETLFARVRIPGGEVKEFQIDTKAKADTASPRAT